MVWNIEVRLALQSITLCERKHSEEIMLGDQLLWLGTPDCISPVSIEFSGGMFGDEPMTRSFPVADIGYDRELR